MSSMEQRKELALLVSYQQDVKRYLEACFQPFTFMEAPENLRSLSTIIVNYALPLVRHLLVKMDFELDKMIENKEEELKDGEAI